MRVLGLMKSDAAAEAGEFPDDPTIFERMNTLLEEATAAGVLLGTDGLKPTRFGKRVQLQDGKTTVVDGPFTESKELIASYALLEVKDLDEAIFWTTRFLDVVGGGECELRPIWEAADFPTDLVSPELAAAEDAMREQWAKKAKGA
jgi:hypothetical protein